MSIWDKKLLHIQEQVYGLYLDGQNQVIAWRCFNTGNSNETLFDIKFVLAVGIGCLASKIVIAHNHPSGILKPSRADINVTARLASVCQLVDIKLEEHLIVSPAFYYSFVDNGVI